MNRQITHLFALIVAMFALLVVFTSRWTVFEAKSLDDNPANRRPLLEEQKIPRGLILARDGTRLAIDRRLGKGETLRYVREYPQGSLFGHAVGYSFISRGRAGLELSRNDWLIGKQNEFASIIDQLGGHKQEGWDVRTSLDPGAQRLALQLIAAKGRGAAVALDPTSGRVLMMASVPTFDPNQIPDHYAQLNSDSASPLFNRATQARYPPGSAMKVVTATAAIDSGRYTPDSIVSGRSPKVIGGVPLSNCCTEGSGNYGPLTLAEGLAKSVNTVWGEVGEKLGKQLMFKYMRRFGFDAKPPIDYPKSQITASGVFKGSRLLGPGDPIDIGRVAIGQERLEVTPLQMAMVAAAVANHGRLMKPHIGDVAIDPDGRVRRRVHAHEESQVMSPATAAKVTAMMRGVVDHGTATAAQIPGVAVAGKTGTAEVEGGAANQAWFICFAPADAPRVAMAVTIERTQGEGGTVAAPIAKQILERLLGKSG